MSKYIKTIPLEQIGRMAVVQGGGRSLRQVKAASGADMVCNGGFYSMSTSKPIHHLKSGGTVLSREPWGCWGFAWDSGPDIRMEALPAARKNYIGGIELLSPMVGHGDKPHYGPELGGKRGRTALALTGDKLVLYCSGDGTADGKTPEALQDELYKLGAETAVMLDGGGSSQCDFGGGEVIFSSRRVHNYICVWLRDKPQKEEKPVSKTVCLDPGHGPGCANGSPDGTYKEHEFAWDMGQRVKSHLERCRVAVVLTKDQDGYPSLTERAGISNKAGVDLFVSLHSNAGGGGGWGTARGLLIYTSAGPESKPRNVAAKAVLDRMRAAGVSISGGGLLHNPNYAVLNGTVAPAMIVEHGFHTSREDVKLLSDGAYRAKLAEATARGVCDFLGVAWADEIPSGGTDTPGGKWGEESVRKAVTKGIVQGDGSGNVNADLPITLRQWCVLADRLGLLD